MLGEPLGKYKILSKLGEGGMGVVYVARHESLGHLVVVKVLRSELSRNAEMVQRFFNEAQAATAIRNLGIVQVFDFGTTPDGCAYFVMELLEGQNLSARLKGRRISYLECCRIARQTANVLQAAHARGITHRDLKPENLFLVPDDEAMSGERVKVLDFGIAKLASNVHTQSVRTRTGLLMGTPNYMSPEQCRGAGAVDARTDIYSLGCILFRMVCGRPPFVGEGDGEVIGAHQFLDAPQPQSLAPDIPPKLAALITTMLAKRPDSRPQTMAAVSQALDDIQQTLGAPSRTIPPWPVSSQPPSPSQPVPSQPPRVSSQMAVPTPPRGSSQPPVPTQPPRDASQPPVPTQQPVTAAGQSLDPALSTSPASTTLGGSAGPTLVEPGTRTRRLPFVLGGFVATGALAALIAMLTAGGRDPAQRQSAREEIPIASPPRDAAVAAIVAVDAAVPAVVAVTADAPEAPADPPDPSPVDPDPPLTPDAKRASASTLRDAIELECLRYQKSESWTALGGCADRLRPFNAALAGELKNRAVQESQAAPQIAGVEAALRDKDLKRARTELDHVWTGATGYQRIKTKYDAAEDAVIAEVAAELERVKSGDCQQYLRLLTQVSATKPPRVAAEAERRVKCVAETSPSKCDAAALAATGKEQVVSGQLAAALASYEAAYACKPDMRYLRKACVIACDLRDPRRAKVIWKRLPPEEQQAALGECTRNGITEDKLNAP